MGAPTHIHQVLDLVDLDYFPNILVIKNEEDVS
jgi:hypothetical protein